MNLPILQTLENAFEKYNQNGYLWYAIIGLVIIGLYTIIRVIA